MPIRFSLVRGAGLITTLSAGHVSAREFVETYRNIFASPDFHPGMNELADLRQMTEQSASTAEFRHVALIGKCAHGSSISQVRAAILVKNRFQYGMSRMYGAHAELLDAETVETFEDPGAALRWLGINPAILPGFYDEVKTEEEVVREI